MPILRLRLPHDPSRPAPGPLAKLAWAVGGAVVLVLGVVFSVAIVALGVVVGAVAWGVLAWKTRAIRRAVREQVGSQQGASGGWRAPAAGQVIEGEAVSIPDERR
ncbi:MAG: hypothetical protein ABI585_10410 [Betaproteobacteria bacterium]